jgi:hypothetical protein
MAILDDVYIVTVYWDTGCEATIDPLTVVGKTAVENKTWDFYSQQPSISVLLSFSWSLIQNLRVCLGRQLGSTKSKTEYQRLALFQSRR